MMLQQPLFFGDTYIEQLDETRLKGQLARVRELMLDGKWRTLREIAYAVGGSEAGVSARLRDLRRPRWGNFRVERQRVGTAGLYLYQVLPKETK